MSSHLKNQFSDRLHTKSADVTVVIGRNNKSQCLTVVAIKLVFFVRGDVQNTFILVVCLERNAWEWSLLEMIALSAV